MSLIIHDFLQGSDPWHAHRFNSDNASEAAAMLDMDDKCSRQELLRMKASGSQREFSDYVQKYILDKGHKFEALARPIMEALLGTELYPICGSVGRLSASVDGIIDDYMIAFEHKQYEKKLFDSVANGVLPDRHQPQCQQIMMVTGAQKVIFVCSDGTEGRWAELVILPDAKWQDRITRGWAQFNIDRENYLHVETKTEVTGKAPDSLPALRIELTGMVNASNLTEFKSHALAVFGGINTNLQTDEDFANAEKTVKWCGDVESKLAAAKEHALSQTQSIDELFKAIDAISAEARRVRLDLDKQVKQQKENRRAQIMKGGVTALTEHITALNNRLGKPYMPIVNGNFALVMSGKKTIKSLQDAVDGEVARCKIEASAIADKIQMNLVTLANLASDHKALFHDTANLVQKNNDDLTAIIKARISDYEKEQADKKERERLEDERKEAAKKQAEAERNEAAQKQAEASTVAPALDKLSEPAVSNVVPMDIQNHLSLFSEFYKSERDVLKRMFEDGDIEGIARICYIAGFTDGYSESTGDCLTQVHQQ